LRNAANKQTNKQTNKVKT